MSHPLDTLEWPVHTERLLLRRGTRDDLDATWAFRRLPEVNDWLGAATVTYDAYRERYFREERLADTLIVELDGRVIGDLMLKVQDGWAQEEVADQARCVQGEIGWAFDPAFGGKGYATEAARALIGLCFGPLGLRRLHADCFLDNEPSWRLMERLGMRRELHSVKESLHQTRGWLDGLAYALLAEEWDAVRGGRAAGRSAADRAENPADQQVAEAIAAEYESLSPTCRADASCLERLLAPDFHEFGASGGELGHEGTAELVAKSTAPGGEPIRVENMRGQLLASGLVMVKYTSENHGRRSNRTSLWRRVAPGRWQVFHHQGTITDR
jgi:RimJ/RimL family protein N-acetyltransferase